MVNLLTTQAILLALLLLSNVSFAQDSIKVAVVNVASLMEKAPQADAATERLTAKFSPQDRVLTVERDLLESEENNLSSNTSLSDNERIKKERELRQRRRTYTRDLEDFREDLAVARGEALESVQNQVFEAIAKVAEKNKIDLVGQDFIYASKRVDITDLVLKYLENNFYFSNQKNKTKINPTLKKPSSD